MKINCEKHGECEGFLLTSGHFTCSECLESKIEDFFEGRPIKIRVYTSPETVQKEG